MGVNPFAITEDLELDLSFTGCIPKGFNKGDFDGETRNLLTNIGSWQFVLKNWIKFVRDKPDLLCPDIVRTTNSLSMGLLLTDDASILELNKEWRNKNAVTDVLSFPLLDEKEFFPSFDCIELGDIIVSVESAASQAQLLNHSLAKELKWLVSHGFLHLLGWDHASSSSLDNMLALQEKLLKANKYRPFN